MKYTWHPAAGTDIVPIVTIAQTHFQNEIDDIFTPDPIAYSRNVATAVVNQFYTPGSELIVVAKSTATDAILAYLWTIRNQRAPWSDEEMSMTRMIHVDMHQSNRMRIELVKDMIGIQEAWCRAHGIGIVCSTTMRHEQEGFLELHRRAGYSVRGSYCYRRLEHGTSGPANPLDAPVRNT
jgi:hypothetical protein